MGSPPPKLGSFAAIAPCPPLPMAIHHRMTLTYKEPSEEFPEGVGVAAAEEFSEGIVATGAEEPAEGIVPAAGAAEERTQVQATAATAAVATRSEHLRQLPWKGIRGGPEPPHFQKRSCWPLWVLSLRDLGVGNQNLYLGFRVCI